MVSPLSRMVSKQSSMASLAAIEKLQRFTLDIAKASSSVALARSNHALAHRRWQAGAVTAMTSLEVASATCIRATRPPISAAGASASASGMPPVANCARSATIHSQPSVAPGKKSVTEAKQDVCVTVVPGNKAPGSGHRVKLLAARCATIVGAGVGVALTCHLTTATSPTTTDSWV